MFCGEEAFLQGVFAFSWCLVVVNRGDVVVNCVVNRGALWTLFLPPKIFLHFQFFFGRSHFRARGFDEADASFALSSEERTEFLSQPP
jgi:hypothetical protein